MYSFVKIFPALYSFFSFTPLRFVIQRFFQHHNNILFLDLLKWNFGKHRLSEWLRLTTAYDFAAQNVQIKRNGARF